MIDTRARKRLAAWQGKSPKTRNNTAIANALGIKQPSVSGWLRGAARPEPHLREALEILTSGAVESKDWTLPEERALVAKVSPMTGT